MINLRQLSFCLFLSVSVQAASSMTDLEKEINRDLEKSAKLSLEKEQLEQKILDLEKRTSEKKLILLKRSSAISYLKKFQFGALLARSQSPSELDRSLKIFERLSEYDLGLFKEYSGSLKLLVSSKKNLEKMLIEISSSVEKLKQQQQELLAKENERLQEVKKQNLASLIKFKGQLARPLDGLVTSPFGSKLDQSKQFVLVSKGLLFKTSPNSSIKSVGPGVIIFSDELQHWRETLIIQHDDNYYSVYTGLKNSKLQVNDTVDLNQVIGSTSSDEFYFELRHFDNPINPKSWFKESL